MTTDRLSHIPGYAEAVERARSTLQSDAMRESFRENPAMASVGLEAIIQSSLRPAFYIHKDRVANDQHDPLIDDRVFVSAHSFEEADAFEDLRQPLEKAAQAVGHVVLRSGLQPNLGTGWLVNGDIMVTNRHVARLFTQANAFGQREIPFGVEVELDSMDQVWTRRGDVKRRSRADVLKPIYVADEGTHDVALFQLAEPFVDAIELSQDQVKANSYIGCVGYPAFDPRDNDRQLIQEYFGPDYNLKRFAPGMITRASSDGLLYHDASTLGGSSGSALLSFENRPKALGLHFGGLPNQHNAAVSAEVLNGLINTYRNRGVFSGAAVPLEVPPETPTTDSSRFDERGGFSPNFLGDVPVNVEDILAPIWGELAETDSGGAELKYHHFSAYMHHDRRMAALTAVNIDGNRLRPQPGRFTWAFDGRLGDERQAGDSLYYKNPIDKGHLVRRLDPVWLEDGQDEDMIREIIKDTYHYTISGPQHLKLNRREWLELEDYLLNAAGRFGFKISVLTGPVFRPDDPVLKSRAAARTTDQMKVPREYWKIAVMRDLETDAMRSAGFILGQGQFLANMNETAFVLGEGSVYRLPLERLQELTRLDLSTLIPWDLPVAGGMLEAADPQQNIFRINSEKDVFLMTKDIELQAHDVLDRLLKVVAGTREERLESAADQVLAEMAKIDPEHVRGDRQCERNLSLILRCFEKPSHFDLLVGVSDGLIRMGHDHPVVICASAQGLLDLRPGRTSGVVAALNQLEKHPMRKSDDAEWHSLYHSRFGRAYKDWFWRARELESEHKDPEQLLHKALIAYDKAAELGRKVVCDRPDEIACRYTRRMNEINLINLGKQLLESGYKAPKKLARSKTAFAEKIRDVRQGLQAWLADCANTIPANKQDPWDAATLVDLGVGDETIGTEEMQTRLKNFLEVAKTSEYKENSPEFMYQSTFRELSRSASTRRDPRLTPLVATMAQEILNSVGQGITFDQEQVNRVREAFAGGGEFQDLEVLKHLVDAAQSICALKSDGQKVGTGFLMTAGDVFKGLRGAAAKEPVVLTAAHVCYDGPDAPWEYENGRESHRAEGLIAAFELADGRPMTTLSPYWSPSPDQRDWLDVSILKPNDPEQISALSPIPRDRARSPRTQQKAFVVGFPQGREMSVALNNIDFQDSPLDGHREKLVRYDARTEYGQSGAPVLVHKGTKMAVHAVHFRGDFVENTPGKTVNIGLFIGTLIHEARAAQ